MIISYFFREVVSLFTVYPPNREESQRARNKFTPEQFSCYEKIVKTFLESSESGQTYILTFRAINRTGLEESIVSCQETIGNALRQIRENHFEHKQQAKLTANATCQRVIRYIDDNWNKLTNLESLTTADKEWEQLENKALEFNPEKSKELIIWKEHWVNNSGFVRIKLAQMIKTLEALKSQITVTITNVEAGSSQVDQKVDSFLDREETDNKIKGTFQIIEEEDSEHSKQVFDGTKSPPRKKFAIQKTERTFPTAVSSERSSEESTEESTEKSLIGLKSRKPSKHTLTKAEVVHDYPLESQTDSASHKQNKLDKILETIVIEALAEVNRTNAGDPNKTMGPYDALRRDIYRY